MRVKAVFKYDGSRFNGFQRLPKLRSVQKEFEDALKKIYKKKIEIKGSGRTDAGVHANNQVAHFDIPEKSKNLVNELNNILNPDIYVKSIKVVKDDFHARNSAKKKEYIYKINLGAYQSGLNDYFFQPRYKVDVGLMRDAARVFIGTHDFRNFVSGKKDNCVTTIYSITFTKTFGKLEIRFIGTGFYRYMIRNLVGALLEVGKMSISKSVLKEMIDNPEKKKTLPTAKSEGLYLNKVWY